MAKKKKSISRIQENSEESDEEIKGVLGFGTFGSSKNKDHSTTSVEYISQTKLKRKFSMFLNRKATKYKKEV